MQGFFWLILQMALLLLGAAAVFFYLGWHWRGQKALADADRLTATADAESSAAERARQEKHAAHAALAQQTVAANREAAELLEAREHQRNLEREILRLSEELKGLRPAPALEVQPPATAAAPPPPAAPALPAAPPATKLARHKKVQPVTESKPPPPAEPARANPATVLGGLRAKISSQHVLIGALNQERDGWHQRVEALSAKAAADPAGFALANKNLARSEAQYAEAVAQLKNLERQVGALERSLNLGSAGEADDLTQIKGIKTALDQQLRAFGIRTYRQIALMSADDLQAFSELLAFKNRAQRDQWQRQARELHEAKYGAAVTA